MVSKNVFIVASICLIAIVVGYLAVGYFYPKKAPSKKPDEFYSTCIADQKDCTYSYLNEYVTKNPPEGLLKNDEIKTVLLSKYNQVKEEYQSKGLTEGDFSNISVHYLLRLLPALDQAEKMFWLDKFLNVEKTTWSGTHMQIYFLRTNFNAAIKDVIIEKKLATEDLMKTNVCNIIPETSDFRTTVPSPLAPCNVLDCVSVKTFCKSNITQEERSIINDILSQTYTDPSSVQCQNILKSLV